MLDSGFEETRTRFFADESCLFLDKLPPCTTQYVDLASPEQA